MECSPIKHFTDKAAYLFPNSYFLFSMISCPWLTSRELRATCNLRAARDHVNF